LSILVLRNDAAKNSLWLAYLSLASGSSTPSNSFSDRQPKAPVKKRLPKNGSGNKQLPKSPKWSPKSGATSDLKSKGFDPKKRKVGFEKEKPFEFWNKTKGKLTEEEYNKHRRTNACIHCGKVGHKFSDCPKPKP
jgi:hypothetical protein